MFDFPDLRLDDNAHHDLVRSINQSLIPIGNFFKRPKLLAMVNSARIIEQQRSLDDAKAVEQALTTAGMITEGIRAYRSHISEIRPDVLADARYHDRKVLALKLLDNSSTRFWHSLETTPLFTREEFKDKKKAVEAIKKRFQQQGEFLYFPNNVLLKLAENYLPKIDGLKTIIFKQKDKVEKLLEADKITVDQYRAIIAHLAKADSSLNEFKNSLCYTLYYRLLAASKRVDLRYIDSLRDDAKALNALLTESPESLAGGEVVLPGIMPDTLRLEDEHDLFRMQSVLEKQTDRHFPQLVQHLSWNFVAPRSNFVQINHSDLPSATVIPRTLSTLISVRVSWLHWLLGVGEYEYEFPKRYAFLFSRLNSLEKFSYNESSLLTNLDNDTQLCELRNLEISVKKTLEAIRQERPNGFWAWLFSSVNLALLDALEHFLKQSLLTIAEKKQSVLEKYALTLTTLNDHPGLADISSDGKPTPNEVYRGSPLKQQLIALYSETKRAMKQDTSVEGSLRMSQFSLETHAFVVFYSEELDPRPVEIPVAEPMSGAIRASGAVAVPMHPLIVDLVEAVKERGIDKPLDPIVELSKTSIEELLKLPVETIAEKMELFAKSCSEFILRGTLAQEDATHQSMANFVLNYLGYLERLAIAGTPPSSDDSKKLSEIEKLSLSSDDIIAAETRALKKLASRREAPWTPLNCINIQTDIRVSRAGIHRVLQYPARIVRAPSPPTAHGALFNAGTSTDVTAAAAAAAAGGNTFTTLGVTAGAGEVL